jgi:hypothetical protein
VAVTESSITPALGIRLENKRPVELLDLTASLHAFGEEYGDFVNSHGFDPIADNVRLYITELRTGSIIAEFHAIAEQSSFVLKHAEIFAAFLTSFNDIVGFFLTMTKPRDAPAVSRPEAERVAQIFEPVAKDSGSQLFLNVTGGDVTINYNYTSDQANTIQNNVRRYLGPSHTHSGPFSKEVMTLHQMRGDTSKAGDRGIIESFGKKPVKLEFMNEEAKRAILDREDNPFRLAFVVDGIVSTADGKPALYKIYTVHDAIDRPE